GGNERRRDQRSLDEVPKGAVMGLVEGAEGGQDDTAAKYELGYHLDVDGGRLEADLLRAVLELDLGDEAHGTIDRGVGEQVEAPELEGRTLVDAVGTRVIKTHLGVAADGGLGLRDHEGAGKDGVLLGGACDRRNR